MKEAGSTRDKRSRICHNGLVVRPSMAPGLPIRMRYYAAACQTDLPCPRSRSEIPGRVGELLAMIDRAVVGYGPFFDVKLVVFPEFAHAAPIYETAEELADKLAVPVPNEFTDRYVEKAKERACYIQTGTFLEVDARWPGSVFNTTCLIGPDGVLSRYRKVNPWLPWEVHASPHDLKGYDEPLFPVVETEIGRLGAAICYDWLFPEPTRALALNGAEVLIRVSAYMDPWGATPPMDWWTLFNRARAAENMAFVVAANQGASAANYPPFSWPGGSMIVDFDGRILSQADPGPGEKIVVGPIDIGGARASAPGRVTACYPHPGRLTIRCTPDDLSQGFPAGRVQPAEETMAGCTRPTEVFIPSGSSPTREDEVPDDAEPHPSRPARHPGGRHDRGRGVLLGQERPAERRDPGREPDGLHAGPPGGRGVHGAGRLPRATVAFRKALALWRGYSIGKVNLAIAMLNDTGSAEEKKARSGGASSEEERLGKFVEPLKLLDEVLAAR